MGARSDGVRKVVRGGKPRLVIDFRYRGKGGGEQRYRRDASVQSAGAARAEAARLMKFAAEHGTLTVRSSPTLSAFVEATFRPMYLPRYRAATRVRYSGILRQGLLDEMGSYRLDEIGQPELRRFAAWLTAKSIGAKGPINLLRTIVRAAVEVGELDALPDWPKGLYRDGKKLPDAPSDEEVTAMLCHAHGWLRAAIALGAFAGLRLGEVRALEVRDVDATTGCIVVRHALSENETVSPKSGDDRVVPVTPELADVLRQAMKDKLPAARVVVNASGRTPGRQHVLAALKELQRRYGLRERSFHSLRHYFCSRLVRVGASVEAVRVLAGHSSLAVTQRYVHAGGGELRSAMAKLSGG